MLNIFVEIGTTERGNQSADEHILTEMKIFEQAGLVVVVEVT